MKQKLWQNHQPVSTVIEDYTSSDDVLLDQSLVAFDLYGSLAHAKMLQAQALISKEELGEIKTGLLKLLALYQSGELILQLGDEDVHTRIENELSQMYPQAGAKLHTGRSRNDQVLTDMRLYIKSQCFEVIDTASTLIETLLAQAEKYQTSPLPGMTHMQPAMLSSVGLWLGAMAENLLTDLQVVEAAFLINDQSPLGSGAAYGVSLPINRELTAEALGFAKIQNNALSCQNAKGKTEATMIHALVQVMATLNKFASDTLLSTTEPFSFFNFTAELGTGSSIMPQKQNWDALELIRARYHTVLAFEFQVSSAYGNTPSGYNRDSQEIKASVMKAFAITLSSMKVAQMFIGSLVVNSERIKKHIPKELFAAHWAYQIMIEKNLPFRQAYHFVKEHLAEIPDFDIQKVLQDSNSQGGPGNLQLEIADLELLKKNWQLKKEIFTNALHILSEGE